MEWKHCTSSPSQKLGDRAQPRLLGVTSCPQELKVLLREGHASKSAAPNVNKYLVLLLVRATDPSSMATSLTRPVLAKDLQTLIAAVACAVTSVAPISLVQLVGRQISHSRRTLHLQCFSTSVKGVINIRWRYTSINMAG